jgi:hypothetical protein
LDDPIAPTMKKRTVVCESRALVAHVTRKSQKCKNSTNIKSKFYGNVSPISQTAESQNNKPINEQHSELVDFCTHARFQQLTLKAK